MHSLHNWFTPTHHIILIERIERAFLRRMENILLFKAHQFVNFYQLNY